MKNIERLKCVVVGDGAVGKTCLLMRYANNTFPESYIPTIFDNFERHTEFDEKRYYISLWDTAGQEDYDDLRKISYPGTHVFIICFDLVNPDSLHNVKSKWIPHLIKEKKNIILSTKSNVLIPVILVGTKLDLRDDSETLKRLSEENDKKPITYEHGKKYVSEINKYVLQQQQQELQEEEEEEDFLVDIQIIEYVECSSLNGTNVDEVFEKVLLAYEDLKNKKKYQKVSRIKIIKEKKKKEKSQCCSSCNVL